jgi:uncharacterized protein (TIGR00304 family)
VSSISSCSVLIMHFSQYRYSAIRVFSAKPPSWYINSPREKPDVIDYSLAGIIVIAVGIAVIFVATMLSSRRTRSEGEVKAAGVVMIGPIPIIFGTDTRVMIVAIILAIILLALGVLTSLR